MMDGNTVLNTIVAESLEIAESLTGVTCIEYGETIPVHIGYIYDGNNWTNPNPPAIVVDLPQERPILEQE